jgi:hypothetical protein
VDCKLYVCSRRNYIESFVIDKIIFQLDNSDLIPLIRAHNGEKNIPIRQIIRGVVKAIEILLDGIKNQIIIIITRIIPN